MRGSGHSPSITSAWLSIARAALLLVLSAGCGPAWDAAKIVVGWCFEGISRGLQGADAGTSAQSSSGGESDAGRDGGT